MKMSLSKDWFTRGARKDQGFEIGAGLPDSSHACAKFPDVSSTGEGDQAVERRVFGALVDFLRRDKGLTVEKLAEVARVDVEEIVQIEIDPEFEPRPRTVCQLADFFRLSPRSLLQLSQVTHVQDSALRNAAIRFAAQSKGIAALSSDERSALQAFVAVLHEKHQ